MLLLLGPLYNLIVICSPGGKEEKTVLFSSTCKTDSRDIVGRVRRGRRLLKQTPTPEALSVCGLLIGERGRPEDAEVGHAHADEDGAGAQEGLAAAARGEGAEATPRGEGRRR